MIKKTVFLFCLAIFSFSLSGQSNELLIEQLKNQVNKAQQQEDAYKALSLALLAYDYLDTENNALQRLLYETYYNISNEEYYNEEDFFENTFNASDWSTDGKQLAVGLAEGAIRLYSYPFNEYTEILNATEMGVLNLDFSPDGKMLVFSNTNGDLSIYNMASQKITQTWEHADYIRTMQWSHDGKKLAAGGDENTIFVYDIQTNERIGKYEGHSDWVRNISWSADDKMIAAASDDTTVTVWSVNDGTLLKTHSDHIDYCRDVAFSPKGNSLISCSDDLFIYFYENATDDTASKNFNDHEEWVMALDWSADGKYIVSASNGGSIILYSTKTSENTYFNSVEPETAWLDIDFSSDNHHFAATSADEVTIYKIGSSQPVANLLIDGKSDTRSNTLEDVLSNKLPIAVQLFYAPDGSKLAILDNEYQLDVIDMKTGSTLYSIVDHEDWIRSMAWSKDGQYIATASDDMTVGVWMAETGEMVHLLSGHTDWVRDVDFSADSKTLLSVGDDGSLKAWDVETGKEMISTDESENFLMTVDWSPKQTFIATQDTEGFLSIRQASDNKLLFKSNGNTFAGSVKWIDDNNLTALSIEGDVLNWNTKTGMSISSEKLTSVSSNGLTAKAKGPYISISGKGQSAFLQGHTATVIGLNWSPSGQYLVSFSIDNKMGIWDAAKGQLIAFIVVNEVFFDKKVIWLDDNTSFITAGSSKITLPTSNIREGIEKESGVLPLSKSDIITYDLEKIFLTKPSVVANILKNADAEFLNAIAEFYEERALSREPSAARTADEKNAAKFKMAAEK